jgi:ribosome-binding factor A
MSRRTQRVEEEIRAGVSSILQRQLRDPRLGFVTVTGVSVTPDLSHARIFVSVLGTDIQRKQSLDGLHSARGFIRSELAHTMRTRVVPDLKFEEDTTSIIGQRIDELIEQIGHPESD